MIYLSLATVAISVFTLIWITRKHPKITTIGIVVPLSVLGVIIALMFFGCTPRETQDGSLNIRNETSTPPIEGMVLSTTTPTPIVTPSPTPDINTDDNDNGDDYDYPEQPYPTPQIIEVPVEVVVELPGKIVEIIKEVFVDTPLDGMDMRKRQLEFIDELNAKYISVFGMEIGGGEYGYNFTSQIEILTDYHFVTADGKRIPCFTPLNFNADQATIDMIKAEINKR